MNGWFLMVKYGFHVGKYTSPMDAMGDFVSKDSDFVVLWCKKTLPVSHHQDDYFSFSGNPHQPSFAFVDGLQPISKNLRMSKWEYFPQVALNIKIKIFQTANTYRREFWPFKRLELLGHKLFETLSLKPKSSPLRLREHPKIYCCYWWFNHINI